MGNPGLVGIFLAAGTSSRMGINKLNLPLGNQFLGSMAFRAALQSKLHTTIAIIRKENSLQWLAPFSNQKNYRMVECEDAYKGQSFSLKAGVTAADKAGAAGVIVLLGDQPLVTPWLINQLIDEFHDSPTTSNIAYLHKGIPKPPVLLARSLFPAIAKLEGDQGARALIRGTGKIIELEDNDYFFDVDTQDDFKFLAENWKVLEERKG
jgi:molybdenum cofactor cytidylyltransferase